MTGTSQAGLSGASWGAWVEAAIKAGSTLLFFLRTLDLGMPEGYTTIST